jgi:hypothetical protein
MGGHFDLASSRRDDPAVGDYGLPLTVDLGLFERSRRRDDPDIVLSFLSAADYGKTDEEGCADRDGDSYFHFQSLHFFVLTRPPGSSGKSFLIRHKMNIVSQLFIQ